MVPQPGHFRIDLFSGGNSVDGSGAGHGGLGGNSERGALPIGVGYGSTTAPITSGSGGGGNNYEAGGAGGAALHLKILGSVVLDGPILLDGIATGPNGKHCGVTKQTQFRIRCWWGSRRKPLVRMLDFVRIWHNFRFWRCWRYLLSKVVAYSTGNTGGGGSGGRIAIYYTDMSQYTGLIQAFGGGGNRLTLACFI